MALTDWRPSRRLDLAVSGALLVLLGAVALWNAFTYPPIGGFDAAEHMAYARTLQESRGIPDVEAGASYTPPGFYLLAIAATEFGDAVNLDEAERGALLLNALLTLGTGVLVLQLGRLLFPSRAVLRWAALAFFISCPVVLKTTAMFHPQPLAMFLSALAFTICARMIVRRRYTAWNWVALALTLAAAQLVRSVAIWTVGLILVVLVVAAVAQPQQRRRIGTALAVAAAAVVLIPLPWYLHLQATASSPVFGRGIAVFSFENHWPAAFYVSSGLPDVITEPHRASLPPRFVPLLYADAWGDYFGIWSWGPPRPELTPEVNRRLVVQSIVGLPLTAVGLAGWLALLALGFRRWRHAPAGLLAALAPPTGLAAVLFYATRGASTDGDIVKTMFMLPAAPFWALSFGFAVDVLLGRSPRVTLPLLPLLAAAALISLAYATFALVS
jgi:4-amino-4-deoxy-L-arabinose transferase-like glycosyltransferase